MWINGTYVNVKNIVVAEPYIMDRSYGLRINGIPVEMESSTKIYSASEKIDIRKKIENFIKDTIIQCG